MFFVFNKEKIKAYLISLGTVAILFIFSIVLSKNKGNVAISTAAYYDGKTSNIIENSVNDNCINNTNNTDNIINSITE